MARISYSESDGELRAVIRPSRFSVCWYTLFACGAALSALGLAGLVVTGLLRGGTPTWATAYAVFLIALFALFAALGVHVLLYGHAVLLSSAAVVLQELRGSRIMSERTWPISDGATFNPAPPPRFLSAPSGDTLILGGEVGLNIGLSLLSRRDRVEVADRFNDFLLGASAPN